MLKAESRVDRELYLIASLLSYLYPVSYIVYIISNLYREHGKKNNYWRMRPLRPCCINIYVFETRTKLVQKKKYWEKCPRYFNRYLLKNCKKWCAEHSKNIFILRNTF